MNPPILELQNVTIMRELKVALDNISLRIDDGENVAILGPNGCGKSTLVKAITRECYPLVRPGMSLQIFGRSVWHVFELRSHLGIVSNDLASTYARDISGREAVLSGFFSSIGVWETVTPAMESRADELLDQLEVTHLRDRPMMEMSSGEARRILVCRALVHRPKALLLDEPSTSLDLHAQRELSRSLSKLAQSGVSILLVTHALHDIIPEITRVIFLEAGKVAADGSKTEMLSSEKLSRLFKAPVEVSERDGYYNAW